MNKDIYMEEEYESDISEKIQSPIIFKDRYKVLDKIGSGSFGEVYKVLLKPLSIEVAVKVEYKRKTPRIYNEFKIYSKLNKNGRVRGIPRVYEFIETKDCNIITMELLGKSLDDVFKDHNNKFSLGCVLKIGIQMIELIENIQKKGYIHRDIKPSNFLLNKEMTQIFIMDFGLSKKYIKNGQHIEYNNKSSFKGTPRYASVNCNSNIEPSRRDDIESIIYILIYFLKGNLPWQGLKKEKNRKQIDIIGDKKRSTSLDELCEDVPIIFRELVKYIRFEVDFCSEPDYEYIKRLFILESKKSGVELEFDW